MSMLQLDNITKAYSDDGNEIVAVNDVDLDIEEGEFMVLVGPSGCGKSTTLRSIAGLETLTKGDIHLDGEVVTGKGPQERDIAMVFQNYALYPHMTAKENMAFGLKMSTDLSKDEINQRVNSAADLMDISDLLSKRPGELSGGQQQRVALGRAIVRDPKVFLMDEPLSNLDAKLRTQMRTELQNLQNELGTTTVYVTHDQTEAMTMADRIAILNDGELQQVGTPLECYYRPANRFVAGFIGSPSMNFIEVQVDPNKNVLEQNGVSWSISSSLIADLEEHDRITIGIRPEDIELESVNDRTTTSDITAEVQVVEPMGDISYIYFTLGENEITATVQGDQVFSQGESIQVRFPEDKLHAFGPETGQTVLTRSIPEDIDQVDSSAVV